MDTWTDLYYMLSTDTKRVGKTLFIISLLRLIVLSLLHSSWLGWVVVVIISEAWYVNCGDRLLRQIDFYNHSHFHYTIVRRILFQCRVLYFLLRFTRIPEYVLLTVAQFAPAQDAHNWMSATWGFMFVETIMLLFQSFSIIRFFFPHP